MLKFLNHLEKECGGHGNGVAFIKDGSCVTFGKAVDLTNETIVEKLFENIPDWFIYHTRVASKGSIKDNNCHPYWNEDKSFILCMNGTVGAFGDLAKSLDITDTELIFKNMDTFNIPNENLVELSPKFIGFREGKVFVTNPVSGGLCFDDTDEKVIIASSFPKKYKGTSKELTSGCLWTEGEELKEQEKKVYKNYGRNWYGNSYIDDDYNWWNKQKAKQNKIATTEVEEVVEDKGYSTIELLDYVDNYNEWFKKGVSKSSITSMIKSRFGNDMSTIIDEEVYKFKVNKSEVVLLNGLDEAIY